MCIIGNTRVECIKVPTSELRALSSEYFHYVHGEACDSSFNILTYLLTESSINHPGNHYCCEVLR